MVDDAVGVTNAPVTGVAPEDPVADQWSEVSAWLEGEEATETARASLARRGALGLRPEEVVGEAWLRLHVTFSHRTQPYPVWVDDSAARIAARAIDSTIIDLLRRAGARRSTLMASVPVPAVGAVTDRIERLEAFRDMLSAINALASEGMACRGCAPGVVVAAALSVVHHVAAGTEPEGRGDPFANLVGLALTEVAGEASDATIRQRRRRCGPCVRRLVELAMEHVGLGEP